LRHRQIAPIALVLALTVAGFIIARVSTDHGARRDSEHRAEVAAAQIRDRVVQAASLTESLRLFMVDAGGSGVTNAQFTRNAFWWLSPADFPAAAWVERVPASRRAAYEQRTGQPIVSPDPQHSVLPTGSRSYYLPATLVSGLSPMSVAGVDLSGEPGMAKALERATRLGGVAATPLGGAVAGTRGLFLLAPASNLIDQVLRPGYAVLFVPDPTLLAATDTPGVQFAVGGTTTANPDGAGTVGTTFQEAGQQFDVVVPQQHPQGTAEALPWIILAAGVVLAAFVGALGLYAGRRAQAQAEADRIFNLSSDLIAVADFEGHFKRVNPALERTLGYSSEELFSRPCIEFVHPADRSRTVAAADEVAGGREVVEFENRFVRRDGSVRWLEWSARAAPGQAVVYATARDITERKQHAAEQAALRRIATLDAERSSPQVLFDAVATEAAEVLLADQIALIRFEPGPEVTVLAHYGRHASLAPVGTRLPLEGESVNAMVRRTGRSARLDSFAQADGSIMQNVPDLRTGVGAPVVVDGRVWGTITGGWLGTLPAPPDAERRLTDFADLLALAVANADSRAALAASEATAHKLEQEQAALRRVATAVARGDSPDDVFAATVAELHAVAAADATTLVRYESDVSITLLAARGETGFELGLPIPLIGKSVTAEVRRTGRTARIDDFERASGPIPARLRAHGIRSGVGAPIVVEGRLWGVMTCGWTTGPPPQDAEARVAQFTDLVETAIANAESRAELLASRARIVATADQTRRRIERDLHDGAQQRLVTLTMKLRALEGLTGPEPNGVRIDIAEIAAGLDDVLDDLRETARGLHPVILSRGGLGPALKALGRRSPLPVELDVRAEERLPEPVEVAAYYVVAEALTNAAKHAHASFVRVEAEVTDGNLSVSVQDDGTGGANPARGSGLGGLTDRVEALGGTLTLHSPPAGGTALHISLPLSG
jgi:PAS domain S-box-containing protein